MVSLITLRKRPWGKVSMIEVKNLKKSFGKLKILDDISFKVKKGEFVTILGPSGCGKTTLIRILANLTQYDSGNVFIGKGIGIMFQEPRLLPWRNVKENICLGLELQEKKIEENKVEGILKLIELHDTGNCYPYELSGGMKQRIALARTLITEPKILLMDEPLSALDHMTRKRLQDKLLEIHKKKKLTILFVTHSIDEAIRLGNKIIIFSQKPTKIKGMIKNNNKTKRKIKRIMKS